MEGVGGGGVGGGGAHPRPGQGVFQINIPVIQAVQRSADRPRFASRLSCIFSISLNLYLPRLAVRNSFLLTNRPEAAPAAVQRPRSRSLERPADAPPPTRAEPGVGARPWRRRCLITVIKRRPGPLGGANRSFHATANIAGRPSDATWSRGEPGSFLG